MMSANCFLLFTLGLLSSSIANVIPAGETMIQPVETITVINDDPDYFYGDGERLSAEDKVVRDFLPTGLMKYSQAFDEPNEPIVVEVIRARREFFKQLEEYIYTMQVTIGESNCPRGTTKTDTCHLIGGNNRECYFEMSEKSGSYSENVRMQCQEPTVANS